MKTIERRTDMKKKKYRVNVHFEGSVDIEVTATDEEQAEELAREVFLVMPEEKIVGYNKENLDTDCEVEEAQQKGDWM